MARKLGQEAAILVAFLGASVLLTWPLCAHFATRIGGDFGDHWQTLWGMWWVHEALLTLHQSPFFSRFVHWPAGVPLVFETFDLTDCLLVLPLWRFLPPIAVFNTAELWSYVLGGYFFYHFAREITGEDGSRPAAFLAGALFTFAPYHFGHALGHMHVVALEWVPLYFFLLVRAAHRPELRWPVLAALALAAASLASWYYLLFCVVLTVPYLAWRAATDASCRTWPALRRALLLGATFLALLWPLFSAMLAARAAEPWEGAHDPVTFSSDLWEFFVPNAAQALGGRFSSVWSRFSGNPAENCDYLGYALLALAGLGAWADRRARVFLATAAVGFTLALGPYLHVGGRVVRSVLLPYGWLTRAVALLDFTGCPVRAGFIAIFGLATAAAFGLDRLLRPGARRRLRGGLAALLTGLALVELWPHAFVTSRFPAPDLFADWARDPSTFAVLDLSGDTRPLWNAVLHQHPIVDAYLSRTPARLSRALDADPGVGPLRHPGWRPPGFSREAALAALRRDQIRYVILPSWGASSLADRDLGLWPIYTGMGLRIYQVPGA